MSDTFLTPDEIFTLTEYKRKDEQRKELSKKGIKFQITRSGKPLVLREELHNHFGLKEIMLSVEPDLQALRAITG